MSSGLAKGGPKVALATIGLGRTQRGYERYFADLYGVLRDRLDITLYGSHGRNRDIRRRIPLLLPLTTAVARALPVGSIAGEYRTYKHDCLAFGISMLPDLLHRRYAVVHVIDRPLAIVLGRLRALFGYPGRLLLTNGSCIPPSHYPNVDHVHHVAEPLFLDALAMGVPESHLTLVPCGIDAQRFAGKLSRSELREKHGIGQETFVVLAVTAVKRAHKRVDHIIEEVSRLEGNILLWIDGNPEDPVIPALARDKLGARCRITHVPSSMVGELYNLADVMVHAALFEAFGLAIVEALSTGLMVLMHDSPHYYYLSEDRECLVDMAKPGCLADRLQDLMRNGSSCHRRCTQRAARVCQRLDWSALVPAYIEMYRKVANAAPPEAGW